MTSETTATVRTWHDDSVAFVELNRAPNNFFDGPMLAALADELDQLAIDGRTRAIVLCSAGKHFCAGADLTGGARTDDIRGVGQALYTSARRIFAQPLPMVAALQGAAVGGGLGLALTADFRVADASARFTPNFSRLGYHPGFGLSVTLPRVIGVQNATDLLLSGRSVHADEAHAMGLCDQLTEQGHARSLAADLAARLAEAAPLAVRSIRATLRLELLAQLDAAMAHELDEQATLMQTLDWREGVRASRDRRTPQFIGR